MDIEKKLIWVDDESVELPLKAIELLCILVENRGKLVTKEELLNLVWKDSFVEESVIAQNIYVLRKAFSDFGITKELIKNVPRRGYRFTGRIKEVYGETNSNKSGSPSPMEILNKPITTSSDSVADKILPEQKDNSVSIVSKKSIISILFTVFFSLIAITGGIWFWSSLQSGAKDAESVINDGSGLIQFTRLTDSGKAMYPAISRDGQNLAYIQYENSKWSIVLQHLASASETVIVEPQKYELGSINFSADGSYVYYVSRNPADPESTIYKIPIYGGSSQKILTNVRQQFSISRDGKKIAFFRYNPDKITGSSFLMTADIDGSNEKIVLIRERNKTLQVWNTYPDWSPDDSKLVVTGVTKPTNQEDKKDKRYFLVVDIQTGKETIVKSPEWELPHQAFWLKDGTGFIVSVQEKPSLPRQLWHLSYPDGRATRITNDINNYVDFRPSFDSQSIVVMNQKKPSNLLLVDLAEPSKIEQITSETTRSNGRYGLTWTADGEYLAFVRSESFYHGELWKIDVKTRAEQQLTFDEQKSIIKIITMPDGKSILFSSNRTGNWHFWKIDTDGRNLQKFTQVGGKSNQEITIDGKWLLFATPARAPAELRRQPLAGGKSIQVLKNAGGVNKASPMNPNEIIASYYDADEKEQDPWKYVLISLDDNKIKKDLGFVRIHPTFEWGKDGKGIYFGKNNDLIYLSLLDDSVRKVVNLGERRVTNLSVSPNGKKIAISAETETSNIFQIVGFNTKQE